MVRIPVGEVTYTSPYIPAEWIEAHGLRARRMLPRLAANDGLDHLSGLCPYARAFLGECNRSAGPFIFVTACDQMRRLAEFAERPAFVFNMPSTCETTASLRLYVGELRRLSEFLIDLGGHSPSRDRLIEIMLDHDRIRRALREARGAMASPPYARALAGYFENGQAFVVPPSGGLKPVGVPLALIGSPVMASHLDLFDTVEKAGGAIVLDATASGERSLPGNLDRRDLTGHSDPLFALAGLYFEIPSAFRRPNAGLFRYLGAELKQRGVRGIVFRTCLWCDTWRAEAERIRHWPGLPMVELDVADEPAPGGSALTRLQSFLEMLQ
ncbi:MAG: 2-hydroxyacyl-CoA dehydratase family protein [Candidatus Sumerlaeia bacterium]